MHRSGSRNLLLIVLVGSVVTVICVTVIVVILFMLMNAGVVPKLALLEPNATTTFTPTPIPPTPIPPTPAFYTLDSLQVIDAFKQAGLEVGDTWPMTKDDYGLGPMTAVEGTRFLIPSLGENNGGRILSFATPEDLDASRKYYVRLAETSAMLFSWLYVRDNILLQINGNLPEERAKQYEAALNGLAGVSAAMPVAPQPTVMPTNSPGPPTVTPTLTVPPTPTAVSTPQLYDLIPARQAYQHHYQITVEFDKFTSNTSVSLDPDADEAIGGRPGALTGIYFYTGETPTPPTEVVLQFVSSHDEWEYLDCHMLYFLLDGEKQMEAATEHDGSVESGYVIEFVKAELTLREFLEIVNSTKVEGRLCSDEFELTNEQMTALRDFASRMLP